MESVEAGDTVTSLDRAVLEDVARRVRERHLEDVEMFYREGYSSHDCYDISSELARELRRLGVQARIVSVSPLLDYQVKHFAVLVEAGGRRIIVDAVPELTGLIPASEVLDGPLVGSEEEYRAFFAKYL